MGYPAKVPMVSWEWESLFMCDRHARASFGDVTVCYIVLVITTILVQCMYVLRETWSVESPHGRKKMSAKFRYFLKYYYLFLIGR